MSIVFGLALHLQSVTGAPLQNTPANESIGGSETTTAYVHAGQTESLNAFPPYASLSSDHDLRGSHAVISFHRLQGRSASGEMKAIWAARLRSSNGPEVVTRFADSRDCPQISATLVMLEQVEFPEIDFPGIPVGGVETGPVGEITMDDYTYTLRTSGTFRSSVTHGSLTVSGDSLSPVGAVMQLAQQGLEPCWKTQPPDVNS